MTDRIRSTTAGRLTGGTAPPDRRFGVDQRAVSETLGYILVFSLVILTISTVSVVGFTGLEDRQAAEEVTNVERALDVLRDNFADLRRYEDPSRATEVRLASGTLGTGDSVRITLGQWDGGGFVNDRQTNVSFEPLVYRSDRSRVVYEAGVVFRSDDGRSIARSSTPFVASDDRAVVPVVATHPGGETTAVGGDRTVLVVGERDPRGIKKSVFNSTVAGDDLRLQIESPRADGWARQLAADGFNVNETLRTDTRVVVDLAADRASLPESHVDVQFR
ncbi:DUF7289 family protein [Halohasta salina]|uniref:DUF7289 family protein n=1 Tax=Halohasta salina TaxID=2961621 RepID=UPI0020A43FCE|nr:hypothetical protein [Halohasta salina]